MPSIAPAGIESLLNVDDPADEGFPQSHLLVLKVKASCQIHFLFCDPQSHLLVLKDVEPFSLIGE